MNAINTKSVVNEVVRTSRGQMIEQLSQSMFDDLEMNLEKLDDIIGAGFKGYVNYTNEELIAEFRSYLSEDETYNIIIELRA